MILDRMRGVESFLDIFGRGIGEFADRLAVDRAVVSKVLALHRRYPSAADEVLILGFDAALAKRVDRLLDGCLFHKICNCHGDISLAMVGTQRLQIAAKIS